MTGIEAVRTATLRSKIKKKDFAIVADSKTREIDVITLKSAMRSTSKFILEICRK